MTTIAYDGKTLVTDSRIVSGSTVFGTATKIFKLKDGSYVAFCGRASLWPEVIEWLNGGDKPVIVDRELDSVSALVVDKKGRAFEIDDDLRPFPACVPWAGGSGQPFALAALALGHTAEEAVEVTCKLDTASGLPIQKVTICK
jgi:hypothetical protein